MWKRWSLSMSAPSGKDKSTSEQSPPVSAPPPAEEPTTEPDVAAQDTNNESGDTAAHPKADAVAHVKEDQPAPEPPTDAATTALSDDAAQGAPEASNGLPKEDASQLHSASSAQDTKMPSGREETSVVDGAAVPVDDAQAPANNTEHSLAVSNTHSTPKHVTRRLSFRSLAFFYVPEPSKPSTSIAVRTKMWTPFKRTSSRSEKQAKASALALRTLIMGPVPPSSGGTSSVNKRSQNTISRLPPDFQQAKSDLLQPKTANAIIAQLRRLPLPGGPTVNAPGTEKSEALVVHPDAGGQPIHAVCLPYTDEEAHRRYFSRLQTTSDTSSVPSPLDTTAPGSALSVGTASLESLVSVLKDLHLVSLLTSPDLGFGQPVGDKDVGPLAGSVPSAETIITGFEEITKQLMSLGFATSKAVMPSHVGIYPPDDRMSVLTYWWGLELLLPEPSMKYLANATSISHTLLNFLSAVSLFNNGVREVLPFIRYISNFVDFEWAAIQSQDVGKGVVCAATWVMPAAMVPRPWDFQPPPPNSIPPFTTVSPPTATGGTTPAPKDPAPSPVPGGATPAPKDTTPPVVPPDSTQAPADSGNNEGGAESTLQESAPKEPPPTASPPPPQTGLTLPTVTVTPATLPRSTESPLASQTK